MIYVVGHEYPKSDIDSVFSSILLSNFLENNSKCKTKPIRFNKKVKNIDLILQKLKFDYPKKYKVKDNDLFVLVDHNDLDQSLNHYNLSNKVWGIIDHHSDLHTVKPIEFNINKKIGATATIIYQLYKEKNIKITKKIAQLFVYAIISDTKNLLLETTTKKDIIALDELYSKFKLKDKSKIFAEIYNFKDLNNMSCSKLLDNSYKFYNFNNSKIRISNINVDSSFNKQELVIDYLKNNISKTYSEFDLVVLSFKDFDIFKTKVFYFGKLKCYFKNYTYNFLRTRKILAFKIKTKLDSLKY